MAMDNSVPPHKPFLKFLLIGASALAVINLALCAYAVHVFEDFDYYTSPLGFMIFVCIWTWMVTAAFFLLPRLAPQLYFKWAIVGVLGLTAFFWLTSWSLLAARVAATRVWTISYAGLFDGLFKRSPKGKSSSSSSSSSSSLFGDTFSGVSTSNDYYKRYDTAWKVSAAASGIGALIWILIVVTLVFYAIACYQQHRSGSTGAGLEGGEKPMPPAAPTEMKNYPPQTTTPNPDQQFAQQQYQQSEYNQQQYNQYQQPPQQYQPPPQHIPS